jgi:DNA-binding FadR family transcriptional regulator
VLKCIRKYGTSMCMANLKLTLRDPRTPSAPAATIAHADPSQVDQSGALVQLRAWLAVTRLPGDGRLPAERELAELLGLSRAELRKALAVLEGEGQIWRHVGKGTFLGARPAQGQNDIAQLAINSNPAHVMQARLALEPELARLACLNATQADLAGLRDVAAACVAATTWREYEAQDARFHHHIAQASHNPVLCALFDTLNAVRRAVNWATPRPSDGPPERDHSSFAEHDRIVDAISHRDGRSAAEVMRQHLRTVEDRLLGRHG